MGTDRRWVIERKFGDKEKNKWVAKWDGTGGGGSSIEPGGRLPNRVKARIFFECLSDPPKNRDTFIPYKSAVALESMKESELQKFLEQAIRERKKKEGRVAQRGS